MTKLLKLTAQELERDAVKARQRIEGAPEKVQEWAKFIRMGSLSGQVNLTLSQLMGITTKLEVGNIDWIYRIWKDVIAAVPKTSDPSSAADLVSCAICEDINDLLYVDHYGKQPPRESL